MSANSRELFYADFLFEDKFEGVDCCVLKGRNQFGSTYYLYYTKKGFNRVHILWISGGPRVGSSTTRNSSAPSSGQSARINPSTQAPPEDRSGQSTSSSEKPQPPVGGPSDNEGMPQEDEELYTSLCEKMIKLVPFAEPYITKKGYVEGPQAKYANHISFAFIASTVFKLPISKDVMECECLNKMATSSFFKNGKHARKEHVDTDLIKLMDCVKKNGGSKSKIYKPKVAELAAVAGFLQVQKKFLRNVNYLVKKELEPKLDRVKVLEGLKHRTKSEENELRRLEGELRCSEWNKDGTEIVMNFRKTIGYALIYNTNLNTVFIVQSTRMKIAYGCRILAKSIDAFMSTMFPTIPFRDELERCITWNDFSKIKTWDDENNLDRKIHLLPFAIPTDQHSSMKLIKIAILHPVKSPEMQQLVTSINDAYDDVVANHHPSKAATNETIKYLTTSIGRETTPESSEELEKAIKGYFNNKGAGGRQIGGGSSHTGQVGAAAQADQGGAAAQADQGGAAARAGPSNPQ